MTTTPPARPDSLAHVGNARAGDASGGVALPTYIDENGVTRLDADSLIERGWAVEPFYIGKTWELNPDWDGVDPLGKYVLPEITLGWEIIHWIGQNCVMPDETDAFGKHPPFKLTSEQARFVLWWYAIHEDGSFIYREGVLQRLKGWGKDPLVAVICMVEMLGPARFAGWATKDMPHKGIRRGDPVGKTVPNAWIDVAATSKEQTRNTMTLFAGLLTDECKRQNHMRKADFGRTQIFAHGGQRFIRAVTSSPSTLEGARTTFVVKNETHHWRSHNNGLEMAEVLERNATKAKGGAARSLAITNAYDPSQGSHAQVQRESWQAEHDGLSIQTGLYYDSLEVPKEWGLRPPELSEKMLERAGIVDLDGDDEERVVRAYLDTCLTVAAGDAWWLNKRNLTNSILSTQTSVSTAQRFWFNRIEAPEDRWVEAEVIKAAVDPIAAGARSRSADHLRAGWDLIGPDEPIVVFGDGSKSDDATALVGCRISDGYCFTLGVWQRPRNMPAKAKWVVNRADVRVRIDEIMGRFSVVAFWFDPSHATSDEDDTRFWDGVLDEVHLKYGALLDEKFWAVPTGQSQHSIMWDMTSHERQKSFVTSVERTREDLRNGLDDEGMGTPLPLFAFDGHPALVNHLTNCYRNPVALHGGFTGVSVRKDGRESMNKIDLAVCLIGARMMRQRVLNVGREESDPTEAPSTGMAWGF